MSSKTKKKSTVKKAIRIILIALLCFIVIALAYMAVVNSRYEYDPIGISNTLNDGEKGVLTLNYNGADGMGFVGRK